MSAWGVVWAVWLVVTAATLGVLEWVTIRKRESLSENLRRWLGVDPPRPWRPFAVALFTGVVISFVAWFIPHIVD